MIIQPGTFLPAPPTSGALAVAKWILLVAVGRTQRRQLLRGVSSLALVRLMCGSIGNWTTNRVSHREERR